MTSYTREDIVAAIQQATAHNGGKPVGMVRFVTLTGITRRAWQGVYWPKWSDALREAGFEGNTLAQRRDENDVLIDAAETVRQLGRVPTEDELRMARRSDPGLITRTEFRALGRLSGITRALRELAQADPDYADLLDLLPELASTDDIGHDDATNLAIPVTPPLPTVIGQVYLARMGKHHKIGSTRAVGRRMYELAIQLPERLTPVHVLETDDPEGIERYWHERFKDKRTNGEWFLLSAADVAAFKRRGRSM